MLALPLRPLVSRCDRFRWPGKSSGPPPFAPSLNIQGDDTHNNSRNFVWPLNRQTASRSRANGGGHNCVPNKNRGDFPPVLESDHTITVVQRLSAQCRVCRVSQAVDSSRQIVRGR
jgi:hypothetical protein